MFVNINGDINIEPIDQHASKVEALVLAHGLWDRDRDQNRSDVANAMLEKVFYRL